MQAQPSMPEVRTQPRSWPANLFLGLIAILVFALPVPFGSNRPWALAGFELVIGLLLGLWLLFAVSGLLHLPARLRYVLPVFVIWGLWLGWIALQIQPLSPDLLAKLAPHTAEIYQAANPGRHAYYPLSLAPDITWMHWLESLAYAGLYFVVVAVVTRPSQLKILLLALALSGAAQAIYGSYMVLTRLEYGFLEPKQVYQGYATGTFINRNHLAGYLEITIAAGIGFLLARHPSPMFTHWRQWLRGVVQWLISPRIIVRLAVGAMIVGLMMTGSRMGNAAFMLSLGVCGGLYVLLRARRLFGAAALLFLSLVILDIWLVGSWFGLDRLIERVESTEPIRELRYSLFADFPPMINAYFLTGSGLGTFHLVYPEFRSANITGYNDHAHNDYAEFLVETGIIGISLLALMVGWTILHALRVLRFRRDPWACGIAFAALAALLSIALHSLVDFNLQIPANAATLVVLMAMVAACSDERSPRGPRRWTIKAYGTEKDKLGDPRD